MNHRPERQDLAIADCNRAIHLDPKLASAYLARAMAWRDQHDYARAKADLDQSIRLDATDAHAWIECYRYAMHEGDLEIALKDISEAIRLAPKNPLSYLRAAISGRKRGSANEHWRISTRPSGSTPITPMRSPGVVAPCRR